MSVACLTRMQDFIKTGDIKWHAFFNWVPGMLARFDTETVVSLIAPRPYMQLMGDEDIGAPSRASATFRARWKRFMRFMTLRITWNSTIMRR